jgi:hypothetical protein
MGDSLREAMQKMNMSVGGKSGKELTREVKNWPPPKSASAYGITINYITIAPLSPTI